MAQSLNMSGAVRFDLAAGRIRYQQGEDALLLPANVLIQLCKELPTDSLTDFGRLLGTQMGQRVAGRVENVENAEPSAMLEQIGAEYALTGLGSVALEFWGRALVLTVTDSPVVFTLEADVRVDPGDIFVAAVMEGVLTRMNMDARVVAISRSGGTVRLLVCNPVAKDAVLGWLGEGQAYVDILARLNAEGGEA